MGQKKWLETEQSVSDILKLKPGLDFDQEEKDRTGLPVMPSAVALRAPARWRS